MPRNNSVRGNERSSKKQGTTPTTFAIPTRTKGPHWSPVSMPALKNVPARDPEPISPLRLLHDYAPPPPPPQRGIHISYPVLILLALLIIFESSFLFVYTVLGLYRVLPSDLLHEHEYEHHLAEAEVCKNPLARIGAGVNSPSSISISTSTITIFSTVSPATDIASTDSVSDTESALSSMRRPTTVLLGTVGSDVDGEQGNEGVKTVTQPAPTTTVVSTQNGTQSVTTRVVRSTVDG